MKRGAPMKRTAFRSKAAPAPRPVKTIEYEPRPRAAAVARHDGKARVVVAVPKENILQHGAYMALVRKLPCARCGIYRPGLIQFCHADILGKGGKGGGIKSDCRLGWPGCGPYDGHPGCHYIVGSTGLLTKEQRHKFEAEAGAKTRHTIFSRGLWPASLPLWHDLEKNHDRTEETQA